MIEFADLQITFLAKEHIPVLAKLWYEEISRHWTPEPSIEKCQQKLLDHLNRDTLPLAFTALHDNQPIGMACLRENDGIQPGTGPWLGSLIVHPDFRKNQIGEALIQRVQTQANNMDYRTLYLLAFDPTIPNWYARLGWKHIGEDNLFGHRVAVMDFAL